MTPFTPGRIALGAVTLLYMIAGSVYLIREGNAEFLAYVGILAVLLGFGFWAATKFDLPLWMLGLLSLLGALHLAGGGMKVHGDVLYNLVLIPIANPTGLTFWKFDQLVHPYGAAVTALISYALLRRSTKLTPIMLAVCAFMIANGAGALNEVIEFTAKMTIPHTDVGGYYNTALDLTFNMLGAFLGSGLGLLLIRRGKS